MKKFSQHIDNKFIKIINENSDSDNDKYTLEEKNAIVQYFNKNNEIPNVDVNNGSSGSIIFKDNIAIVKDVGIRISSNVYGILERSKDMIKLSKDLLNIKKWSDSIDFLEFVMTRDPMFNGANYEIKLEIDKILELEESKNYIVSSKSIGKFNL